MKVENLMSQALAKFGGSQQCDMAVEEMGELIVALNHFKRELVNYRAVLEEIVDVTLMMEQIRILFDPYNEFHTIELAKLKRLEELLKQ